MSHTLRIPNKVAQLIRRLHPALKKKVRAALQAVIETPDCGKALQEELASLRSYRPGRYRIVYRIADNRTIEIVAIGPRRYIYEETYRKVRNDNR